MSGNVIADVSQHSRESGRVPVQVQVERLSKERDHLTTEKMAIEAKLSLIESEKRDSLTMIYRRNLARHEACAATNEIESKYHKDRAKLVREKRTIEERLNDIKNQIKDIRVPSVRDDVVVLLRIEALLAEILKKLR